MINVPFSPPDITEAEIESVAAVLRSGWITTGPVTKQFERDISAFCGVKRTACLSSGTAAMELSLHLLGVGPGDEVITSAYTYSASASVALHVGASVVLADTVKGGVNIDPESVRSKITGRTKAVIPVDIVGVPVDYDALYTVLEDAKGLFSPGSELQRQLGRIAVIGDAAHAFGAVYKGESVALKSDFSCFSFHAVKNMTTSEGGCVCFNDIGGIGADDLYEEFMLYSTHGQDKDALAKTKAGWEYDILLPAYKCNMSDLLAAVGVSQLARYADMLSRRRALTERLDERFARTRVKPLKHETDDYTGSFHVYLVRIEGLDESLRNRLIAEMLQRGVSLNVHFKPLPLMTAYKNLGFSIEDYPNAYDYYKAAVSLPLFSTMTIEQAEYTAAQLLEVLELPEFSDAHR